eukprot:965820-Prorocentrum_minimum.AAC.1
MSVVERLNMGSTGCRGAAGAIREQHLRATVGGWHRRRGHWRSRLRPIGRPKVREFTDGSERRAAAAGNSPTGVSNAWRRRGIHRRERETRGGGGEFTVAPIGARKNRRGGLGISIQLYSNLSIQLDLLD